MITCPSCNTPNVDGADTCESCNGSLVELSLPQPATAVEAALLHDRVGVLAQQPPVTASPDETVATALKRMVEKHVGCLLVIDREGKLAGIFSERDALMKLNAQVADYRDRPIGEFATRDPATIDSNAKVAFALNRMHVGGYRHLPVLDSDGRPVTVISIRELLRYLTKRTQSA